MWDFDNCLISLTLKLSERTSDGPKSASKISLPAVHTRPFPPQEPTGAPFSPYHSYYGFYFSDITAFYGIDSGISGITVTEREGSTIISSLDRDKCRGLSGARPLMTLTRF